MAAETSYMRDVSEPQNLYVIDDQNAMMNYLLFPALETFHC